MRCITRSCYALLLLCVFSASLIARKGYGRDSGGKIYGMVWDASQEITEEEFSRLERAALNSEEEFTPLFRELLDTRPQPGAVITARNISNGNTARVVSNSEGRFSFTDLTKGIYEVSAKMPEQSSTKGGKRLLSSPNRVRVVETCGHVGLALHPELITIKGRITDFYGLPVAGAKVTGTPVPVPEVGLIINTVTAVSDKDGFYELHGFTPPGIYRIAGYLNGGDLRVPTSLGTYVEIHVESDGFKEEKKNAPQVPLVTEAQLAPARRLLQILNRLAETMNSDHEIREREGVPLPSSHGCTITGIDIFLDAVDE